MNTVVTDRPDRHRFEIAADGQVAGFAAYTLRGNELTLTHTVVEDAYEGHGLGSVLVRHALDEARERGLSVLPACPFVRSYVARHEDYLPLVPADARARYDLPA